MIKKVSSKEFARQKLAARNKIKAIDGLISKGVICVDYVNNTTTVNYLLWHSYSTKGLVQFITSINFYCSLKRAYDGLKLEGENDLRVSVDYGKEANEYDKLGIVPMVDFCGENGFKEIVN